MTRFKAARGPQGSVAALCLLVSTSPLFLASCSEREAVAGGNQDPNPLYHAALTQHLADLQSDQTLVPVIFTALPDLKLSELDRIKLITDGDGNTDEERRRNGRLELVKALQDNSDQVQGPLLEALEDLQEAGHVEDIRELWATCSTGCLIKAFALDDLQSQALASVRSGGILLDLPRRTIGAVPPQQEQLELPWGLDRIGMRTVVEQLETLGDGAVVCIVDQHFDTTHPEIAPRLHPETPGMDFSKVPSVPIGTNNWSSTSNNASHGMQVAGVIVGKDTGVAPDATLMLLQISNAGKALNQMTALDALQFLIDGPSDTQDYEPPDVVNLSHQWSMSYQPADELWREKIDILTQIGVLVVTIAGNGGDVHPTDEGPLNAPPRSLSTPGRVPNALTVGATASSADDLWLTTSGSTPGSNTGPVSWTGVSNYGDYPFPPGLTKPDLVAPGVEIPTITNPYIKTGTSFAAPHVSGVAALLMSVPLASPSGLLKAYELRYLLQESSKDLGAPGADVAYGWGRLDAVEALALLPVSSAGADLEVKASVKEWEEADLWIDNDDDGTRDALVPGTTNHVYARVRNLGDGVAAEVRLRVFAAPASPTSSSRFDPNAAPGDSEFQFLGEYQIPLLGPASSRHATATGVVHWDVPALESEHWVLAVQASTLMPSGDTNPANDIAIRDFLELPLMVTGRVGFELRSPGPSATVLVCVEGENLPAKSVLYLDIAGSQKDKAKAIVIDHPCPASDTYASTGTDCGASTPSIGGLTSYIVEDGIRHFCLESTPDGAPFQAGVMIRVPPEQTLGPDARVRVRTWDSGSGDRDELTLLITNDGPPGHGGPFHH